MARGNLDVDPVAHVCERAMSTELEGGSRAATRDVVVPLAAWTALVVTGVVLVYVELVAPGSKRLDAPPLHGAFSPRAGARTFLPVVVGVVALAWTRAVATLPWRRLLVGTWALGAAWAVSLAGVRGWQRIAAPFDRPGEYRAVLPEISSLGSFLREYVERIAEMPLHVQGHPPGFVIVARGMEAVGLGGALPLALLCVAVGAAAGPLALVVVRDVVDESWARRAAPFVAIAPSAIWLATSADAFFAGIGAAAVALVVVATGRGDGRGTVCAVAGGALFCVTVFLSYGLVLLAAVPLAVACARRAARAIALAMAGALPVVIGFAIAGFWWFDGLLATRDRYHAGIASRRPYELFLVANLSILAIALGPAIAVGLWRLRNRRLWVVVGGALAAVTLANLSGMSKSEVERIWLPFMPFILVAGAALGGSRAWARTAGGAGMPTVGPAAGWVAVQATTAIVVESLVRTAW